MKLRIWVFEEGDRFAWYLVPPPGRPYAVHGHYTYKTRSGARKAAKKYAKEMGIKL